MSAVTEKNGYKIVDRRGLGRASAITTSLYATPRNSQQQDFYRPRPYGVVDNKEAIDEFDWSEILEYSRQLFAQLGNVGSAIVQRSEYAFGDSWKPTFLGKNEEWGNIVEAWLRDEWYPNCDVRGGVFDFNRNLVLSGIAEDVDGDDVVAFATREDGWPLLKYFGAHEIGSRGYKDEVKGGPIDGAEICNGIIVDKNKRFLGVKVLGEKPSEDQVIPAFSCHLQFDPEWRHTYRGIPKPGRVLLDCFDTQDIDVFLKRGVKLAAAIGLLSYTESGEAPTASDIIGSRDENPPATAVAQDVKVQRIYGGEIMHMRAMSGEKVEQLKAERPHPNEEAFVQRLERRIMRAIRWFYELLDPSKIGGASVRMIQDQARLSVASKQTSMRRRALRCVQFAVAQGMKGGFIPENNDGGDFLKWGFTLPAQLTVDQGYDEQADQQNLLIGSTTLARVCGKKGSHWQENRKQRKVENFDLVDNAVAIMQYAQDKHKQELTFREALDMMQRDGANQRAQPAEEKEDKEKE